MYVLYIVFQTQILFISSYNIACVRSSATQNLPNLTPPPPPSPPICNSIAVSTNRISSVLCPVQTGLIDFIRFFHHYP